MNFFRKLLGLGPKALSNVRPKPATQSTIKESTINYNMDNVYPILTTRKTTEYKLNNEFVRTVHQRENMYAELICIYIFMDPETSDANGQVDAFQIITENENEDYVHTLRINSEINFDKLDLPFSLWNETGQKLDYKILSCPISPSSTSKILSKKHMLEAHKMLGTDELFVSIPLSDVIFVVRQDLNDDNFSHFLAIHNYIMLDKANKSKILCEDLFVIKDGEISGILPFEQISKELLKKE